MKNQSKINAEDSVDQAAADQPVANQVDEVEQLKIQLQRVAADFDNYRRRTDDERKQLVALAQAQTLLELTPVLDNFRRATDHLPADLQGNNWVTGVLYVEKQLEQIFEQFGVCKIKTVGEVFDPKLHEAISQESSDDVAENHIIAEVEGGYMLKEQVLKPAKVKVSSGSAKD